MREGDRILINKGISKKVMIIARTEIPHSNERIFVTKSGGKYTIGLEGVEIGLCLERKKSNVGAEASIMTRSFRPLCHERFLDKNANDALASFPPIVKPDLKNCSCGFADRKAPRLLLVFGDDLQVEDTCKAILDRLVPVEQRGFNFERFDGRTASWEQIEASLMTPPFFPGKKLLWVENAPYFFSREQKGELGEKILELWRDGKRDEAAKLLIDLLSHRGLDSRAMGCSKLASPSRFWICSTPTASSGRRAGALLSVLQSPCDYDLTRRKGAEGHRLGALLDRGLPEWSFLLLTAVQVDRRTRLFKRFEELGAVLYLGLGARPQRQSEPRKFDGLRQPTHRPGGQSAGILKRAK